MDYEIDNGLLGGEYGQAMDFGGRLLAMDDQIKIHAELMYVRV